MTRAVTIIGAGLFGCIVAAALRRKGGHDVTVIADQRSGMASAAAGCVMKPSWAGKMSHADYDASIRLLDELYRVRKLEMGVRPMTGVPSLLSTYCHWVSPSSILVGPDVRGTLGHLRDQGDRVVVVATGAFRSALAPAHLEERVEPRGGWAFTFPGELSQPFIQPWAPYKQVVALQIAADRVWVGDGTSLKPSSMTPERRQASLIRCAAALDRDPSEATILTGLRPYVSGLQEPAFLHQFGPSLWYLTGGAKNGTLGAAWAALRLLEELS